jgi:hypothetical protein
MRGVLVVGLVGTGADLVLLNHYEDVWQLLPLILIAAAVAALIANYARPGAASLKALRGIMVLCVVAGVLGIGLHFRGAAAFQREMDPSQSSWSLMTNAIRVKAPPVLSPGLMAQLGLLGLIVTYRHPDEGDTK